MHDQFQGRGSDSEEIDSERPGICDGGAAVPSPASTRNGRKEAGQGRCRCSRRGLPRREESPGAAPARIVAEFDRAALRLAPVLGAEHAGDIEDVVWLGDGPKEAVDGCPNASNCSCTRIGEHLPWAAHSLRPKRLVVRRPATTGRPRPREGDRRHYDETSTAECRTTIRTSTEARARSPQPLKDPALLTSATARQRSGFPGWRSRVRATRWARAPRLSGPAAVDVSP